MATTKAQRVGIWIIGITMLAGTIGTYAVIAMSMNQSSDISSTSNDDALKQYEEQQKAAAKQNAESAEALEGYEARAFDANNVKELKVETLVEGNGDVVQADSSIKASYFGWTSDGKLFDSSNKKDADDAPISLSLGSVITGWKEGLTGAKVGSVVRLTIPSDKAYGETGSGTIPANSPLEFIVKIHSIEATTDSGK